jgi:peptide/nickel transport system ATP-binding protein
MSLVNDQKKLIEVNDLSIQFQNKGNEPGFELKQINFMLNKGETLGIVGESGSGKSITSLAIMGLLGRSGADITGGNILFHCQNNTVDLTSLSEKEYRSFRGKKISMIFQEPMTSLNPALRCGFQVEELLKIHEVKLKDSKQKVLEVFDLVKLPRIEEIYKSYPHQLSGGQRQRVMIAMAIICEPDLVIADEPTTALDVTVQKEILELLKLIQKKSNMGLIFISHDLGVIGEIADRVMVMRNGLSVESGSVAEILMNPMKDYTKALIACRPHLNSTSHRLPTVDSFNEEIITETGTEKSGTKLAGSPILEIRNLKTYYNKKQSFFTGTRDVVKAVDDISFQVFEGETLGLVGESGCGKSTLGRSIVQLIKPDDGDILYRGKSISKLSAKELRLLRRKIQIIFQDPFSSLNPRHTIGSILTEPIRVHGIRDGSKSARVFAIELLERVGLEAAFMNRYPHEFSGGQRQRIGIARALAMEPEFIICDESASALDVSVQAQIINLLNDIKDQFNLTYIFISHDLTVVKYFSDRVVVMRNGKIEEINSSEQIYTKPQSDYTRLLINSNMEL